MLLFWILGKEICWLVICLAEILFFLPLNKKKTLNEMQNYEIFKLTYYQLQNRAVKTHSVRCYDATMIRARVRFVSHAEASLAKAGGGQARLRHGGRIALATEVIETVDRSRGRLTFSRFEQSHFGKPTLQARQSAHRSSARIPFSYFSSVQIFGFHSFRG